MALNVMFFWRNESARKRRDDKVKTEVGDVCSTHGGTEETKYFVRLGYFGGQYYVFYLFVVYLTTL
jgi:hypothetical protein